MANYEVTCRPGATQILKGIFQTQEVSRHIPPQGSIVDFGQVLTKAQEIVNAKAKVAGCDLLGKFSITEPVRLTVEDKKIDLMVQSAEGDEALSILAKIEGVHGDDNIPTLVRLDPNNNVGIVNELFSRKATSWDAALVQGLLGYMSEAFGLMPQKQPSQV